MANFFMSVTLSEDINVCPNDLSHGKQLQHTSLVFKFYFFIFLQKARKYTLSSRNNKYTYFFMNKMHNLQTWKLNTPTPTHYCVTVCI